MKIALDPGHGGDDSGAVGPTELEEADVNLSLGIALAQKLESIGIENLLTRSTDVFIELQKRCDIANEAVADYFISIHCNYFDDPNSVGIETLYVSDAGYALAEPIQKALISATGDRDRGLKYRNDLFVLNGTDMPAILIEIGFISHPPTEAKFKTHDYQQTIVEAIAAGLCEFLDW